MQLQQLLDWKEYFQFLSDALTGKQEDS